MRVLSPFFNNNGDAMYSQACHNNDLQPMLTADQYGVYINCPCQEKKILSTVYSLTVTSQNSAL